jgi:hypothetical protein
MYTDCYESEKIFIIDYQLFMYFNSDGDRKKKDKTKD